MLLVSATVTYAGDNAILQIIRFTGLKVELHILGLGEGTSLLQGSSPLSLSQWLHWQQQQELPSLYDCTTAVLTYSFQNAEKSG